MTQSRKNDPSAAADAKLKALEMAQRGELATLDADMRLVEQRRDWPQYDPSSDGNIYAWTDAQRGPRRASSKGVRG